MSPDSMDGESASTGQSKPIVRFVEDDDVGAIAFERSLDRTHRYLERLRAHDGLKALSILSRTWAQNERPCAFVLGLSMPRSSGLEFLDHLRSDSARAGVGVFVLTTSAGERDLQRTYTRQVAGFFVKGPDGESTDRCASLVGDLCALSRVPARRTPSAAESRPVPNAAQSVSDRDRLRC